MHTKSGLSSAMLLAMFVFLAQPSHATLLTLTDDSSTAVNLGFNFNFFGQDYSEIYVGSNGNITFGAGDSDWTESSGMI